MIDVWMTKAPETDKIIIQRQEFTQNDFPLGLREYVWPVHQGQVDEDEFNTLLRGEMVNHDDWLNNIWEQYGGGE